MGCYRRIDRALEHALHLPLGTGSRYVVISDCHRGEGTTNDNFLKNAYLYEAAMEHYIKRGFFYLELGERGGSLGKPLHGPDCALSRDRV